MDESCCDTTLPSASSGIRAARWSVLLALLIGLLFAVSIWRMETGSMLHNRQQQLQTLLADIQMSRSGAGINRKMLPRLLDRGANASAAHPVLPLKSSYRLLLVGDSLTVGYYWSPDDNRTTHPYMVQLQRLLETRHSHLEFNLVLDAQGGECVMSACSNKSLLARVADRVLPPTGDSEHQRHEETSYDIVILMGGTNDIFHDFHAEDVLDGLMQMHEMSWRQSAQTLALTIPQYGEDETWRPPNRSSTLPLSESSSARTFINDGLREFCSHAHGAECTLVDLDRWFPRHGLTPEERREKWAENVHPTPAGYDEIGRIVYEHVRRLLPQK